MLSLRLYNFTYFSTDVLFCRHCRQEFLQEAWYLLSNCSQKLPHASVHRVCSTHDWTTRKSLRPWMSLDTPLIYTVPVQCIYSAFEVFYVLKLNLYYMKKEAVKEKSLIPSKAPGRVIWLNIVILILQLNDCTSRHTPRIHFAQVTHIQRCSLKHC